MQAVNDIDYFVKQVDDLLISDSSIGIHGITFNGGADLVNLMSSIMKNGLYCKRGDITSTVEFCGSDSDCNYRKLYNYTYFNGNNYIGNAIINIPRVLEGSNNRKYFVGDFRSADARDGYQKYNDDIDSLWINRYVQCTKVIPKEFIMGTYIYDKNKDKTNFIMNPYFWGLKNAEQQQLFVDKFIEDVQKELKSCHIIEFNDDKINQIYKNILYEMDVFKKFKTNTYYLEQALEYIQNNYHIEKNNTK